MNRGSFRTTRWNVVRAAGDDDTDVARDALTELCEAYWYPLYTFVRRSVPNAEDARDLTQSFFAHLLDKKSFSAADPDRGRFRTFLMVALKNFIADQHDRATALKRGGGQTHLSLDFQDAEGRYLLEPADELTPEKVYERNWAREVVARALGRLAQAYEARGKAELFRRLQGSLTGFEDGPPRTDLARELGMEEKTLNVALHRMRKRFRESLRAEIEETVAGPEEIEREMRELSAILFES